MIFNDGYVRSARRIDSWLPIGARCYPRRACAWSFLCSQRTRTERGPATDKRENSPRPRSRKEANLALVLPNRLGGLTNERVIDVAVWSRRIERCRIRHVQGDVATKAFRQIRIGQERHSERHSVGFSRFQNLGSGFIREFFIRDITTTKGNLQLGADSVL